MNICLFSIKLPILVKVFPTVIEMLTFMTLKVLKVYRFPKRAFLLALASTQLSHWQNKTNKIVSSTADLVLIKVLRQEQGYDN